MNGSLGINAPSGLHYGDSIVVEISSATLYDENRADLEMWKGNIYAKGNGKTKAATFTGIGKEITLDKYTSFDFGYLGDGDVTITIELWGAALGFFPFSLPIPYQRCAVRTVEITNIGELIPEEEEDIWTPPVNDGDGDGDGNGGAGAEDWIETFPWKWAGIAFGALLLTIVVGSVKR